MKPKTIPKGLKDEASTADSFSKYMPNNISCPQGSVPIRRTTKEELIIAKYLKSLGNNYPTDSHYSFTSTIDRPGYHVSQSGTKIHLNPLGCNIVHKNLIGHL